MSIEEDMLRREACSRLMNLLGYTSHDIGELKRKAASSGSLTMDEFLDVLFPKRNDGTTDKEKEANAKKTEQLGALFHLLDKDGDNTVELAELDVINQSNPGFDEDRKTAALSFNFSIHERTDFLRKFEDKKGEKICDDHGHYQDTMDEEEFRACWKAARGFPPSERTVTKVFEQYDNTPGARSMHAVDFARRCMGNAEEMSAQPFVYAFFNTQLQRHKDIAGLMYLIPFLVLFTFFLLSGKGLGTAYFLHEQNNNMMTDSFEMPCVAPACNEAVELNYEGIGESAQFFEWVSQVVIPAIWTGGDNEPASGVIQHHILPVGALRIESLRVEGTVKAWQHDYYFANSAPKNTSQGVPEWDEIRRVFPDAAQGDLGRTYPMPRDCQEPKAASFVPNVTGLSTLATNAFTYQKCNNRAEECINGQLGKYPCGGFNLIIPFIATKQEALNYVAELSANNWIDIQTRAVFVRHFFFNKDTALLYRSAYGFEISSGGQWQAIRRAQAFKYFSWKAASVGFIIFIIVYWLALLGFIFKFCTVLRRRVMRSIENLGAELKLKTPLYNTKLLLRGVLNAFSTDKWLVVDFVTYTFFLSVWIYRAVVWARIPADENRFYQLDHYPYDLEDYAYDLNIIAYLDSMTAFLVYLRLFKYFKLFRVLDSITRTIYISTYELYGLFFTALVVTVAFSLSGFILYGDILHDYHTVEKSMETLLRFVVGDFDYETWAEARRVLSPIFFALIFIVLVLILFNSLVAVLADNYQDVVKNEFDPSSYRNLIERDPTSALTFERGISLRNSPLVQEILRFPRWIRDKCMSDEERERRKYETKDVFTPFNVPDTRAFFETMSDLAYTIYYGTRAEGIEAFLRFARSIENGKVEEEQKMIRRTFALIHSSYGRKSSTSRLTLWEVLRSNFGVNLPLYLILCVHKPHVALGERRARLVLSMMEAYAIWKQQQAGVGGQIDALEKARILTEKTEDLAQNMCDFYDCDDNVPVSARGMRRRTTQFQEDASKREDPWTRYIEERAMFSGLCKEDRDVEDYDEFKSKWRDAHQKWIESQGVGSNYDTDTIVDEVVTKERFDRVCGNPDVREDVMMYDTEQTLRVGFRATQRAQFLSGDNIRRARELEKLRVTPAGVSEAEAAEENFNEVPLVSETRGNPENPESFEDLWERSTYSELNEVMAGKLRMLSEIRNGESKPTTVPTKEFRINCTATLHAHSARSIIGVFYRVQRQKVINIVNLALYIPFLALFTLLMTENYGIGEVTRMSESIDGNIAEDQFEGSGGRMSFGDIRQADDVYSFLDQNVAGKLYRVDGGPEAFDGVNILVGAMRIRQIRAAKETKCGYEAIDGSGDADTFYAQRNARFFNGQCVPPWNRAERSDERFGNTPGLSPLASNAFAYEDCIYDSSLFGDNSIYACGGHALTLPTQLTQSQAKSIIGELKTASWITEQTRAIVVEGFFYNYNNDMFVRKQYMIETTAGGLYIPATRTDAFTLFKQKIGDARQTWFQVFLGFFVLLLFLNIVVFIAQSLRALLNIKHSQSTNLSTAFVKFTNQTPTFWFELLNYVIFITVWGMRFRTMVQDETIVFIYRGDAFPGALIEHSQLGYGILVLDSFNALLCYMKIFMFVRLHPQLNILVNALLNAFHTIIAIFTITFVIITGFAFGGHIVFGNTLKFMSSMGKAYETLIIASIPGEGEDALLAWWADRPIFAGFYYTLVVLIVMVLMLNMMTSVVAQAYGESKDLQFDPRPLEESIRFDPSIDGKWFLQSFVMNPATREIVYWIRRLASSFEFNCKGDKKSVMKCKLANPRSFYSVMARLVDDLETGNPREAGVAAAELLYIRKTVAGKNVSKNRLIENKVLAQEETKEQFKLYGMSRILVKAYAKQMLPNKLVDVVLAWCMDLPTASLALSRETSVVNIMEVTKPWLQEARNYSEFDEGESQMVRYLTTKVGDDRLMNVEKILDIEAGADDDGFDDEL